MVYSHDTRPEPAAVQGTGLMAQTHCTGPGQEQGQGMKLGTMGFYISILCTVHTTQGQGQIQGTIVFYCSHPIPCPSHCPGPVQCV